MEPVRDASREGRGYGGCPDRLTATRGGDQGGAGLPPRYVSIARKLSAATGPVALYIPRRGLSAIATQGNVFQDPQADDALIASLKDEIGPRLEVRELDTDINDAGFARAMADHLDRFICARRGSDGESAGNARKLSYDGRHRRVDLLRQVGAAVDARSLGDR